MLDKSAEDEVGGGEKRGEQSLIDKRFDIYLFATALSSVIAQPHRRDSGACESLQAMASVATSYISVGGNRHPGAADCNVQSGVLAYGADHNVALWEPLVGPMRLTSLLSQIACG